MKQEFIDRFNTLNKIQSKNKQILQQRGRDFEDLINNVLDSEKVLLRKSYHTKDNFSEQIDGAIEINNRIFLIETKWVKSGLAASDLFAFIGKIENKFFGTLGVFISREKLSDNFINALNKGRRQSVVVIHGDDIDQIFNIDNNLKISDYINHSLKVCSYDNILHFSVKKFIEINKDNSTFNETNSPDKESIDFIKENLLNKHISEDELLMIIESNNTTLNERIFEKIILKYSDMYSLNLKNFNFTTIENFNNFIKLFTPSNPTIEKLSKKYYNELIFKDITIYHRDTFNNIFNNLYIKISEEERKLIENRLAEKLNKYIKNSDWNSENYLTEVLKPIWKHIIDKDQFKSNYLSIYLRDTLDKFAQKKFANKLVIDNEIDFSFAENWLKNKIEEANSEYQGNPDENDIKFIARTYIDLNKILNKENWLDYIKGLFNNIK